MKRTTFRVLGGVVVFGLAAEALPPLGPSDQCVGTAEEITLCGPSDRMLERRLDHTPEGEYDAFGGWAGGWIASGQVNSITTST